MISPLKAMFGRLGGGAKSDDEAPAAAPVEEYKGYRIQAAPYKAGGQYQTAGLIEKGTNGDVRQHRFVRAETHPSLEDAVAFSTRKAKQIIDEQGDRIFDKS
jgi:hypothetical protein